MGSIEAALADLELLGLGERLNYAAIAKEYSVDRTTLLKRYRGVQSSCKAYFKN